MTSLLFKIVSYIRRKYYNNQITKVKKQFAYCGVNVDIPNTAVILSWDKFEIGDNSLIGNHTVIYAGYGVRIGKNCLISSNCGISSINHEIECYNRKDSQKGSSKPVTIHDNVWIGMNVIVLPGVEIGENSIVGAGSVVTKNIPSNEIWVGNPARFVKKIFVKS